MAGKTKDLPISGEPLTAVESPIKKKKKSKKNKHSEEKHEVEVPQEVVTNNGEEELSNKEKKKKRKREEKEKKNKSKSETVEDVPEKKAKSEEDSSDVSEQQKVVVTGKGVEEAKYVALTSFARAKLPENVLGCCKTFEKPSPIQSHSWPFLLDGRDLIGIARTGSGNTLAFGIPEIMHMMKKNKNGRSKNLSCLVLSPTRELADHISDVLSKDGEPCGLKSICVYGGIPRRTQITAIRYGVDIVIGTPGRLKDLIDTNELRLSDVLLLFGEEAEEEEKELAVVKQKVKSSHDVLNDPRFLKAEPTNKEKNAPESKEVLSVPNEELRAYQAEYEAIWLQELNGEIVGTICERVVEHVPGNEQKTDFLTKEIGRIKFKEMRNFIGVREVAGNDFKLKGENVGVSLK